MQLIKLGLSVHRIQRIFISHLHGDHYLGLMGLIFSMHLQKRESDLHIHSHYGLDEIILAQLRYSRSSLNFRLIFHPLQDGVHEVIADDELFTVETFPLEHKIPTSGFLFREKPGSRRMDKAKLPKGMPLQDIVSLRSGQDVVDDKGHVVYKVSDYTLPPRQTFSYAYCSDSQPSDSYRKVIQGVDLLYHEATFMEDEKDKARLTKHSTAKEAAEVASEAGVKKLLIGHFSARYKELSPVLNEAKSVFSSCELAVEGQSYELKP